MLIQSMYFIDETLGPGKLPENFLQGQMAIKEWNTEQNTGLLTARPGFFHHFTYILTTCSQTHTVPFTFKTQEQLRNLILFAFPILLSFTRLRQDFDREIKWILRAGRPFGLQWYFSGVLTICRNFLLGSTFSTVDYFLIRICLQFHRIRVCVGLKKP